MLKEYSNNGNAGVWFGNVKIVFYSYDYLYMVNALWICIINLPDAGLPGNWGQCGAGRGQLRSRNNLTHIIYKGCPLDLFTFLTIVSCGTHIQQIVWKVILITIGSGWENFMVTIYKDAKEVKK